MARRPELGKQEQVWSRKDLDEMQRNLSLLSEHGVREFYQRAYRGVRHHQFAYVSASAGDSGAGAGMETVAEVAALGYSARIQEVETLTSVTRKGFRQPGFRGYN